MNELFAALEIMIARIVNQEIAKLTPAAQPSTTNFGISLKGYAAAYPSEFAALIPAAPAVDGPTARAALLNDIKSVLLNREGTVFNDLMERYLGDGPSSLDSYIQDCVINDSTIHDHIVEVAGEVQLDKLGDKVQDIVSNMSWSTTVD